MNAMQSFRITLVLVWIVGAIGGVFYSQYKDIPTAVAVPVLLAFLVELTFYFGLGAEAVRSRMEELGNRLPLALLVSASVPYLLATVPTGLVSGWNALYLLGLVALMAWWFVWIPRRAAADLAFLVFVAAVYLLKPFRGIYPDPVEGLRIDSLGQLMWFRIGMSCALLIRKFEGTGFGFVPTRREWLVGAQHYAFFMPLGLVLMYGLEFAKFDPLNGWWWRLPANFLGIFLVVALAEELFFRGILQQQFTRWFGLRIAVVVTAVIFGACHLPFREFPNWRFAIIAAAAAWFYGRAFVQGRGIRAAMVAHGLTVATWRSLFQ
jgi:CAAX protease family protein